MTKEDQQQSYSRFTQNGVYYHPEFARIFNSVNAAILLAQLLYWRGYGGNRSSSWIYKSSKELALETALSEYQISQAIKILKKFKLLKTSLKGRAPATRHFWIDMQALNNLLTRLQETDKLSAYKSSIQISNKHPTLTKNTQRKPFANDKDLDQWF